ncbi:hypothetical protein BC829DRAFT_207741 [Chytridium lagenaria]|nr:hypothetical protein BC829DRAFT_207741 [Chytridium lagenaria]
MFFDDIAPPPQNASFQQHISIPQSLYQNLRVAAAVAEASASDHASLEPKVEMNLSEFQLLSAIACMSRPLPISTTTTSTTAAAPPTVVPSTTSLPTLNITLPTPSTPTSSNPPTSKRPRVSTVSDTSTPPSNHSTSYPQIHLPTRLSPLSSLQQSLRN